MKKLNKLLTAVLLTLFATANLAAQAPAEKVITFRFVAGRDMFYVPYENNSPELSRLYSLVDEWRTEITSGKMPIHVDGYCSSFNSSETNLKTAAIRSNRVKSELITIKGLKEEHFITQNHNTPHTAPGGKAHKDVVVVTLRIPITETSVPVPENSDFEKEQAKKTVQPVIEEQPEEPQPETQQTVEPQPKEQPEEAKIVSPECCFPYCFAVRSNLLHDAILAPSLGVEWRINENLGLKVDGAYSFWGNEHGKVQKLWLVNPEARYYMGSRKRFYVGAAANFGECNIYQGTFGKMFGIYRKVTGETFSNSLGYQGNLWNAGITAGYQLFLNRSFSLDFNLGLGYTSFGYNSFTVTNETRVYAGKDKSKKFWGPTQSGISLVWTIN